MKPTVLKELKAALLQFAENVKWRRSLTPFEKRIKLVELKERLDVAEETYVAAISEVLVKSLDRVVKDIEKMLQKDDITELQNIRIGYHDLMVNTIRENLIDLYFYGKQAVYEELGKKDALIRKSRKMMRYYRVKAEAIITELEGKLKARAILIVLEGVKRQRSDKDILAQVRGLSERRLQDFGDPDFEEEEHPRVPRGQRGGGRFTKKYGTGGVFSDRKFWIDSRGDLTEITGTSHFDIAASGADVPFAQEVDESVIENGMRMNTIADVLFIEPMGDVSTAQIKTIKDVLDSGEFTSIVIELGFEHETSPVPKAAEFDAFSTKWIRALRQKKLSEQSQTVKLQDLFSGRIGNLIDLIKNFLIGSAQVHVIEAMNEGRANAYSELSDEIGAYQWSAILDKRTCPICNELDGMYFSSLEPYLDVMQPPLHMSCRCILVGVLKEELERYAVRIQRMRYGDVKKWTRNKFWLIF